MANSNLLLVVMLVDGYFLLVVMLWKNGELFTSKFYYYLSYLDWLQSEKRVKVVHWSSLI